MHGAADPIDTLQSYLAVYVREEVQMEGLVRDLDRFSRLPALRRWSCRRRQGGRRR